MPKSILIFSDGTGQAGGLRPDQRLSNVYKLYRATRIGPDSPIRPDQQIAYYDPGLGTANDRTGTIFSFADKVFTVLGLATGLGINENIIDCYAAIIKNYLPGDRICLFGFSRGAYTVRSLAAVLKYCGVPTQGKNGATLPVDGPALRVIAREAVEDVYEYQYGKKDSIRIPGRDMRAARFRSEYHSSTAHEDGVEVSNVAPDFIGVFDTVAALGAPGWTRFAVISLLLAVVLIASALTARIAELVLNFDFSITGITLATIVSLTLAYRLLRFRWKGRDYDMSLDPRTLYSRHALAIDESRRSFARVPWSHSKDIREQHRSNGPFLEQVWFAGNHSDIGGSYPEDESRLSDIALQWMLEQIGKTKTPIVVDSTKLNLFPSSDGMQHCEVETSRERFKWWAWPSMVRKIDVKAKLHSTVLDRFALPQVKHCRKWKPYRPEALRHHELVSQYYE